MLPEPRAPMWTYGRRRKKCAVVLFFVVAFLGDAKGTLGHDRSSIQFVPSQGSKYDVNPKMRGNVQTAMPHLVASY